LRRRGSRTTSTGQGRCYTLGTRAFFFCVPLVFWFFGPHFMLVATVVLLAGLYFLDRAPVSKRVLRHWKSFSRDMAACFAGG
jgi:uncharacterized membrane protein